MTIQQDTFASRFKSLTTFEPLRWQKRLFTEYFEKGELPTAADIPTGLGKTAIMALWLIARAADATLPRRLVYVVDRRAVVDQATSFAVKLRDQLDKPAASAIKQALGLSDHSLPISTLRGQYIDNREWLEDPTKPAIAVGTVDMIGSRLLFEGYGVSRKMRPYHAGLLGADTLVMLDEAHLVPPFESLLAEIARNSQRYGPADEMLSKIIPKFHLVSLSATGRRRTATPFALEEKDFRNPDDEETVKRLSAKKRLILHEVGGKKLEEALAEQAWALSDNGKKAVRVIVYCNSRDVAEKVKAALDNKAGKSPVKDDIELFVGARRVRERINSEQRLRTLGFLADEREQQNQTALLVATSAGEVGVDIDADHMVCDLVTWERMVQRFGRVNRRGGNNRQAEIVVLVEAQPEPKKAAKDALEKKNNHERLNDKEQKAIDAHEKLIAEFHSRQGRLRAPFGEALKKKDGEALFDVSPEGLRQLYERARLDETLSNLIKDASSTVPLRPALNRALVDAWSMTSLPEHTGRPEVEPWLRGWVDELPQTTVAWRRHLPVRSGTPASKKDIEDFIEAAPLHVSETLETESYRVMKWLQIRADKLDKIPESEKVLSAEDVVAMLLKIDSSLARTLKLGDLLGASKEDKKRHEDIDRDLRGKTLVMDARFRGLRDGLLQADADDTLHTADNEEASTTTGDKAWIAGSSDAKPVIRFRILQRSDEGEEGNEGAMDDWHESLRFDLERSADGEATRWLSIQKWRDTSNTENDRAAGRPQALTEHQSWTAERAANIGQRLGLPDDYVRVLRIAARLHDEGKRAKRWQRAFQADRDRKKFDISEDLAKTRGPINQAVLGGYRHEFGSLPYANEDAELKKIPEEMQDLVLHLIAAHHGFARPLIATEGCEDAPPSVLEERARKVALRFARLQKRWGPWGLAWWEALLRAADAQASRANDDMARKPKEND